MEPSEDGLSTLRELLSGLYRSNERHVDYQPLPPGLEALCPAPPIAPKWRDPRPRVRLLQAELRPNVTSPIVELGANSGYQSVVLAQQFPHRPYIAVEMNPGHANFIRECARLLELENVVVVQEALSPRDIAARWPNSTVLDFNVAHHFGTDLPFAGVTDVGSWWSTGLPYWLSSVGEHTEYWFSCGYRLGGRRGSELHSLHDAGGFAAALSAAVTSSPSGPIDTWTVGPGARDGILEYVRMSDESASVISAHVNHAGDAGIYRGEFFRRPILRFVRSGCDRT